MAERTVLESIKGQRLLISAAPETSVREAACIMTRASCGSILVTDTSGGLVGIVTERDLMTRVIAKALDPASTTVAQVMTRNPHCVAPEMTVSAAVLVMIERGFRHLPILTKSNKIMGVFSVRDALPREIDTAESMAEFHDQMNDALG
ncbi:MAG: CBS domain-containing protein [Rhodocyclaceae bacterium]|nr:CBS domain-containing protein [Rhodocyclaceae bacterium]MBK9625334.1 CBS domain-containing protein [Rhodocyclaceae bacterium]MBL0076501.1 CBS domain-containing protein [Rhodocyclaceae bacterium]MBP6109621.1 CBS domain-containing protein [Rhodocyclaceae bacterium]MBP6278907.1 CBS domain-containing protein [Rhodocyclaceae bacterium]